MMPDLGQRVATALNEMQSLSAREVDRYLRALRSSDPELAGRLGALLNLPPGGPGEPTVLDGAPPPSSVVPLVDPARLAPVVLGEPTASVADARATTSFRAPGSARCPDRDAPGGVVLNRYRLLHAVGRGSFGDVWKAFDPKLEKHVAVKVARPDRSGPQEALLDEARVAASVRHPAIVHVYDVGASADGWYIVSEFIDGESLRNRIEHARLSFDHAARVVATVARALHAAHLTGLVHRDVKPGNILLDRAGNAYLTDFGLAVREEDQFSERSKVSGTLAYMPPEQISGDTHLLDGRADIYALGAVLYELLTGRQLFRAADLNGYREQILRKEPRPPRSVDAAVPMELERICLKCLAKEVRDRYPTAQDLANELDAWLAGSTRSLVGAAPAPAAHGWWRPVAAGAALAVLGAGVIAVVATFGRNAPPTRPDGPIDNGALAGAVQARVSLEEPPKKAKVRAVKELVWLSPRGRDVEDWDVVADGQQVKVSTSHKAVLQFGEAKGADWTFSITVRQVGATGRAGVILGHRADPETQTARFELIELVPMTRKTEVQRTLIKYPLNSKHNWPAPVTEGGEEIKEAHAENTFGVVVRNNVLSEVYLNGKLLPKVVGGRQHPPAAGGFGVYNFNSTSILSNAQFNGQPIPLQVECSTPAPERP